MSLDFFVSGNLGPGKSMQSARVEKIASRFNYILKNGALNK